jgi:hypothetical protein
MDAIQGALVPLSNVLLFIGIVLAFYGLVGIQCFGGLLKGRCVVDFSKEFNFSTSTY